MDSDESNRKANEAQKRIIDQRKVEQEADELYHACASVDWLTQRVHTADPEGDNLSFAERVAMIHADLSAALTVRQEGARMELLHHGIDKKPGVPMWFAEALLLMLDTCREYNIPIGEAVHEKLAGAPSASGPAAETCPECGSFTTKPCWVCAGAKRLEGAKCTLCGGSGTIAGKTKDQRFQCPTCRGTGKA